MQYLYPFIISFAFIFLSELGDKTQILVLSFSSKNKIINILLGVALGTFFSHGLAIEFGSQLSYLSTDHFIIYLKLFTYFTFILFGIIGFRKLKNDNSPDEKNSSKDSIIKFFSSLCKNCTFIVAITIAIGELGDKTFLASMGLGVDYPSYKISLICGSICGMVASDSIAIFLGKWLGTKISDYTIELLSNSVFILFGLIGIFTVFI